MTGKWAKSEASEVRGGDSPIPKRANRLYEQRCSCTDLGFSFTAGYTCRLDAPSLTCFRIPLGWRLLVVSLRGGCSAAGHC